MKQCIFFFIFHASFFTSGVQAQQNHFIYLQTENKQPFYIKLDNSILSSSVSGYLIVPKLTEGTYNFALGFPKKEWPEQKFACTISNADAGYLVKNFGDKGWGLFNLQTLDVTMSGAPKAAAEQENKTDEFSTLLSSAVNDPSILKKNPVDTPVVKESVKTVTVENKPEPVKGVTEETKPEPSQPIVLEKAEQMPAEKQDATKLVSHIKKIEESNSAEGTSSVYVVTTNGLPDTISISIPPQAVEPVLLEKASEEVKPNVQAVGEQAKALPEQTSAVEAENKQKFLPIEMMPTAKPDSSAVAVEKVEQQEVAAKDTTATDRSKSAITIVNSDCINNASDEDFLKVRKKMASASSDEDMMNIAKKAFKQKCFSTDQIKNLGVLFLKEDGRYNFFDLAYPHVWDSSNYRLLENQLVDPYYSNRFKAMIRH